MAVDQEENSLGALRIKIDQIDRQIQSLINDRASLAQQVAEVKLKGAEDGEEVNFYRPEREAQVLTAVMERNEGPVDNESMAKLFREIMSVCLALEKTLSVAFLGPKGTFTQEAALKHFGHGVKSVPLGAIDEVFREVESGAVTYGVVPVENSTEGVVNHTLDSFIYSPLHICGEVELRIHQNFLIGENTRPDHITRIYSHQQSLAQCRKWLDAHWPQAERISVNSNAEAARLVKSEWNSAAIAGEIAGEMYGLIKQAEKVEDEPNNSTRFLIIGNELVPPSGNDKTSLIVSMRNRPGALHELLAPFHKFGIDLTRLETRPSREEAWSYVFFIDLEGHYTNEAVQQALSEISNKATDVKLLGSYPKAVL